MAKYNLKYNKFLLFGDSITEFSYNPQPPLGLDTDPVQFGFGSALTNAYARKLDVLNRGFAGYNSRQARKLLPRIIENEHKEDSKILISTVFFGTNDAIHDGPQKVELSDYIDNSRYMVQLLQKNGIKPILIGPGKHDAEKWNPSRTEDIQNGRYRTNEANFAYSESLKKVAADANVPFVDLYKLHDSREDWTDLLIDGIHFTGEGYKVMYKEVIRLIREWYPELAPENLEMCTPMWRDITEDEL